MKRHQHVGGNVIVSLVRPEAQLLIRFNSVETCILQLVGSDLVDETNSSTFLSQIENYPPLHLAYSREGFLKLLSTVAPQRANSIAGKTLGVQPYWNVLFLENIAMDESGMFLLVEIVPERD